MSNNPEENAPDAVAEKVPEATVKLKLIGAESYSCRKHNVPLTKAGGTVTVTPEAARHLLKLTYKAGIGNYKHLFTRDLKAEVDTARRIPVPIEERNRRRQEAEQADQEAKAAVERAEAAEARSRELEERISRLEEATSAATTTQTDAKSGKDKPAEPEADEQEEEQEEEQKQEKEKEQSPPARRRKSS